MNPDQRLRTQRQLIGRLQALCDCVRAQHEAMTRADLAEVQRQADRFDRIRAALGPLTSSDAADPQVGALLQQVAAEHERLRTAVGLATEEVRAGLARLQRGRPAAAAYGRQVAALAAVKEGRD